MKKKSIQPMGNLMLDLEKVISSMIEDHDLQMGEVLNLVRGYIEIHFPDSIEEYDDNSHPVFYYGPKE